MGIILARVLILDVRIGFFMLSGWCDSMESRSSHKETSLGSSKYVDRKVPFTSILSTNASQNPEFFNWNKVLIRNCDGASFAGNQSEPKVYSLEEKSPSSLSREG